MKRMCVWRCACSALTCPRRRPKGREKTPSLSGFNSLGIDLSKSRDTNSVPWSTRIVAGSPTCRPTLSSTLMTSIPRNMKRGSSAGDKRENVSTIVSTRSFSDLSRLVIDEVHGPGLVRSRCRSAVAPQLGLDPSLRRFVAQLHA